MKYSSEVCMEFYKSIGLKNELTFIGDAAYIKLAKTLALKIKALPTPIPHDVDKVILDETSLIDRLQVDIRNIFEGVIDRVQIKIRSLKTREKYDPFHIDGRHLKELLTEEEAASIRIQIESLIKMYSDKRAYIKGLSFPR